MQTGGQIWAGTGEGHGHFQGWTAPLPSPQETTAHIVVSLTGFRGPAVTCESGAPSLDLGSRGRVLRGEGGVAGGQTPGFPHSCLPALPSLCPTSFSLCSMTLFVCLQMPQAEEAPMGRDWPGRMSVEGRLPALPVYPHPQPLALGLFGHPSPFPSS